MFRRRRDVAVFSVLLSREKAVPPGRNRNGGDVLPEVSRRNAAAHVLVPTGPERAVHAPQHLLPLQLRREEEARGAGEDRGGVVPPEEVAVADLISRRGAAQRPKLGQDPATREYRLGRRLDGNLNE